MKRIRYVFCLLICAALMFMAVQKLPFMGSNIERSFSFIWLIFALLVFAGNLAGILFADIGKKAYEKTNVNDVEKKIRLRQHS